MRECKHCHEVKPLRKFWGYDASLFPSLFSRTVKTWLCSTCADEISFNACLKEAKRIAPDTEPKEDGHA